MEVVNPRCAGIDIHKRSLTVCRITPGPDGGPVKEIRTFRTLTPDLLGLADWLAEAGVPIVAMESTGVYWVPLYNLFEGRFELVVANAAHIKAVPGRKTDVRDAEWIADLLRHGLLQASFIPPRPQRELRELTRFRTELVRERSAALNRLGKTLEAANIKLGSVVASLDGVSARAMLAALVAGISDPAELAGRADPRLRTDPQTLQAALAGVVGDHQRFMVAIQLEHLDELDARIAQLSTEIEARLHPFERDIGLLTTIPGISRRTAEVVLAEVGPDMTRFGSARQIASWAGLCPGNHESAGRRRGGRTRKGSPWLRSALVTSAHAAGRTNTYLGAQYRRLIVRRGRKRAAVAVAHSLLVIIRAMLLSGQPFRDLGATYFDEHDREHVRRRLVKRLQDLGYAVDLAPAAA